MTNEIVLYQPNESVKLEVRVQNETVWLSQQQIADLFGVGQPAISKHIANIYKSGELSEEGTYSILEYMGNDSKRIYTTKAYNLDVILSVGYRVNSANATRFRQWANKILKEYLLRGYAYNQRLLAIEERMDRRLQEHTEQIHELQNKVDFFVRTELPPAEQIFYNGQFFAARALLEKIIKTAKTRVIVIDAYVDAATFEMLDVRARGVKADIYSGKDLSNMQKLHNTSSGLEPIDTHIWKNASHDRWLIIDETVYHCGHSLKDMGQKLCAIAQLGVDADDILKKIR